MNPGTDTIRSPSGSQHQRNRQTNTITRPQTKHHLTQADCGHGFCRAGPSCSKRRYLNELVKGHFVNWFCGFNVQYSNIFTEKNVLPTFFQQKNSAYLRFTQCKL